MNKIKQHRKSVSLIKFFSGIIIFSFLFWSENSNSQEEISFSVVMPEEYIEKKDLSKLDRSINIPVQTSFYSKKDGLNFANYENSADVIIARNYLIEEAIYEEKVATLDNSLISNIGFINPQFLNSNYDNGRKYSIIWGLLYQFENYSKIPIFILFFGESSSTYSIINDRN